MKNIPVDDQTRQANLLSQPVNSPGICPFMKPPMIPQTVWSSNMYILVIFYLIELSLILPFKKLLII